MVNKLYTIHRKLLDFKYSFCVKNPNLRKFRKKLSPPKTPCFPQYPTVLDALHLSVKDPFV